MRCLRGHPAFTMIELLVVVLLLSSGILYLLQTNFLSLRSMQDTQLRLEITKGILEYEAEYLTSLPFSDPALALGTYAGFTHPYMLRYLGFFPQMAAALTDYRYIVAPGTPASANLKLITIQVTWTDSFKRSRTQSVGIVMTGA